MPVDRPPPALAFAPLGFASKLLMRDLVLRASPCASRASTSMTRVHSSCHLGAWHRKTGRWAFIRRALALVLAFASTLLPAIGWSQTPTQAEDLFGTAVHVTRNAAGAVVVLSVGANAPVTLAPGGTPSVERISVGSGAAVIVRVAGPSPAGAIVAGSPTVSPAVLFSGSLGRRGEDVGERFTTEIIVRDLDGDGHPDVVLGERHEDVQLCSLGAPLINAQAVRPTTLRLARVALEPAVAPTCSSMTTAGGRDRSTPSPRLLQAPPVLPALSIQATSSGTASALTDRDPTTAWAAHSHTFAIAHATLAGIAAESVVLTAPAAPSSLPARIAVIATVGEPSAANSETLYLDVSMPSVAPGARVDIPIVPARGVSCLAVVVTDPRGGNDGIAELALATPLDRDTDPASTLVQRLGGSDGDQAALLLGSMGERVAYKPRRACSSDTHGDARGAGGRASAFYGAHFGCGGCVGCCARTPRHRRRRARCRSTLWADGACCTRPSGANGPARSGADRRTTGAAGRSIGRDGPSPDRGSRRVANDSWLCSGPGRRECANERSRRMACAGSGGCIDRRKSTQCCGGCGERRHPEGAHRGTGTRHRGDDV